MSYPGASQPYRPGRVLRRLGWACVVLAVVSLAFAVYVFGTKTFSKVDDFQRVGVSSSASVAFKVGDYIAYYEASEPVDTTSQLPGIPVRLTSPSGKQMMLATLYGNNGNGTHSTLHYEWHGHYGVALWTFHIAEAGKYQVDVGSDASAPPGTEMAFGTSIAKAIVGGVLLIIVGLAFLAAAIVLLIIGFVKKGRGGRPAANAAGPFQPYPGSGQQWPQQQQYPQQQYPPQQQQWPPPDRQ